MIDRRTFLLSSLAMAGSLAFTKMGFAASDWQPEKPVEIVLGVGPGGATDRTAREIADFLKNGGFTPKGNVVSNKPGGGHSVALAYTISRAGDPTVLQVTGHVIIANNVLGRSPLSYKQVTPIATLFDEQMVFATGANSSIKSAQDLIDKLKADPGSVSFSISTGIGTTNHISVLLLTEQIGVDPKKLKVVSFNSSTEGVTAIPCHWMHLMSDTVSRHFARNILSFAKREFSDEAYDRARAAITDMIGVMLAGSRHEGGEILRSVILPTASAGKSRVFGTDLRLNALDAALLNGTAAHMLDYDDSNSHLHGHVSVAILPAILAVADERGINGRDILKAYLTGFEAAARLGNAVSRRQYTHGWHPTTTVGLFGAVAAASVLSGLSEEQTATALGIATSLSAGIKSNFGTMTKPLIVGHANRNALFAVSLAKNSFTSGAKAFEHHQGFFAVFNGASDTYDATPLVEDWNSVPRILDPVKGNKLKRYPCCYALAAPLDGILALREEHELRPDEIAEIRIGVHPIRYPHINVPAPQSPLEAKFSTSYTVARALVGGSIGLEDFEEETRFTDPATRRLMEQTTLYAYEGDNTGGAAITLTTTDGRKFERFVEGALGSTYDRPLPDAMVRQKFLNCARRALPQEDAQALLGRLQNDDFA